MYCDGMQVYYRVDQGCVRRGFILKFDPLLHSTQIVAQMRYSGRLDTREDDSW